MEEKFYFTEIKPDREFSDNLLKEVQRTNKTDIDEDYFYYRFVRFDYQRELLSDLAECLIANPHLSVTQAIKIQHTSINGELCETTWQNLSKKEQHILGVLISVIKKDSVRLNELIILLDPEDLDIEMDIIKALVKKKILKYDSYRPSDKTADTKIKDNHCKIACSINFIRRIQL